MGAAATAASAAVATAQPAVPPPLTTECLKVEANDRDDGQASTSGRQAAESSSSIGRALSVLRANGVVAVPTETVYGLAANALSADAVTGIFAAKGRPSDNPLIVHVSSLEMLASLYPPGWLLPHVYEAAVAAFWPGPLTILLPRSELVADAVTAGLPTMAVRMPAHPVALRLIEACGFPLAAPSANSSGRPSPTQAAHVVSDLGGRIPLVLDGGPCGCGVESTVLDALRSPPAVLRPGGVMFEQLVHLEGLHDLQVYRRDFVDEQLEQAPTTPGMKYRHYSPAAQVVLLDPGEGQGLDDTQLQGQLTASLERLLAQLSAQEGGAPRVGVLRTSAGGPDAQPGPLLPTQQERQQGEQQQAAADVGAGEGAGNTPLQYVLGHVSRPGDVARELFRGLRHLDAAGVDVIVVEGVRDRLEGLAVMNRLRKAASRTVPVAGAAAAGPE